MPLQGLPGVSRSLPAGKRMGAVRSSNSLCTTEGAWAKASHEGFRGRGSGDAIGYLGYNDEWPPTAFLWLGAPRSAEQERFTEVGGVMGIEWGGAFIGPKFLGDG